MANVNTGAQEHRKFGMRDKIAYAAGDFGCNMSFALKSTVQTFWLVYMYMEIGLLSALVLVTQIWDAINDPLIGSMIDSDKKSYKMGKFKTYIFVGACGLLVAGALVFLPLPEAIRLSQETGAVVFKSIIFIVAYVIWDAFYTVANVPYGSMLPLVTEDKGEQAQLSTWRSIGSMVGNMVPGMILPFIIWKSINYDGTGIIPGLEGEFHTNPKNGKLYEIGEQMINPLTLEKVQELIGKNAFLAALIMGVLGFVAFMFMIKAISIRVDENTVKTSENTEKINVFKSFGKFMRNRPAVGVTLAAMGMFLGMQSATTANTIMFATYFGKAELSGVVMIIGFLPMVFFIPFIKKIVDRFGKKEASVMGTIVSLVGGAIMMIFPLMPTTNLALIVYMAGLVFFGVGMGVYTCVSWAMMGDAIDYNEWKFGTREDGTVYSLHSFFRKLAQGVGPTIALALMGVLGYVSEKGVAGQTLETAKNMCWLVAGLYLFSAVLQFVGLAFIYNIDKKTLETMNAELAERHSASAEEV